MQKQTIYLYVYRLWKKLFSFFAIIIIFIIIIYTCFFEWIRLMKRSVVLGWKVLAYVCAEWHFRKLLDCASVRAVHHWVSISALKSLLCVRRTAFSENFWTVRVQACGVIGFRFWTEKFVMCVPNAISKTWTACPSLSSLGFDFQTEKFVMCATK